MKPTINKGRALRLVALACLLTVMGCAPKGAPGKNQTVAAKPALTVTVISPVFRDLPASIHANGSIQPWQEASIGAEVGGLKLTEVLVNVGDTVHKGQMLARFSEESIRTDVAQQEAAVAEAQANLVQAKANADRAKLLDQTGAISQQDILQYQTTAKTAATKLAAARALLNANTLKLRYTRVLAPDNGVISSRTATVGAVVPSGTELFKLIRDNRLEWRAQVLAEKLAQVQPGQAVKVQRLDGAVVNGAVRKISPTVDTNTLSGLVYVDVPAASGLKAGMFVNGDIVTGNSKALTLPLSTVLSQNGYNYVMKVGANRHVHQVKVSLGRHHGNDVEVLSGIQAGDKIVATGAGLLTDGDLVRVAANTGASQGGVQ